MGKAIQPTVADGIEPSQAPPLDEVAAAFPDLEVLNLIGRGGMGAVFKARQKSLDRHVALKILPQSLAEDPSFQRHFESEAKALAALGHPNIVTIHDFGHQGGFYFLLMEFVDGANLRELLATRKLAPEEALAIVPQLCEALEFAHGRGIVHRDIKPENLLLDRDGRVKVADFGIAKIIGAVGREGDRMAGTLGYMAPEQAESPGKVDSRADIYSLGVVFYEMLTGERPGETLKPPSNKVAIDLRIDEVVLRALENQPEQRWQTAAELRTQIDTITSTPAGAPQPNRLPDLPNTVGDRTTPLLGFCAIVSFVIGGFILLYSIFSMRAASEASDPPNFFAIVATPAIFTVAGLALGGIWLRRLRGTQGSRSGWAFALTFLSLSLPVMVLIGLMPASVNVQSIQSEGQAKHLEDQLQALDAALEAYQGSEANPVEIELLEEEKANTEAKLHQLTGSVPSGNPDPRIKMLFFVLPVLIGLIAGVYGCMLGWLHLAWLRAEGPPRVGAFHAMFSALFWPVVAIFVLVFVAVVLPLNDWRTAKLGIALGIIAAFIAVVWIAAAVWAWVKNEEPPGGRSPARTISGAALILAGVVMTISMISGLQSQRQDRERDQRRSLESVQHRLSRVDSQLFSAEKELEGVIITQPSNPNASVAEREAFDHRKKRAEDWLLKLNQDVMRLENERDLLALSQREGGGWWETALVPILIGLALALSGAWLLCKPSKT